MFLPTLTQDNLFLLVIDHYFGIMFDYGKILSGLIGGCFPQEDLCDQTESTLINILASTFPNHKCRMKSSPWHMVAGLWLKLLMRDHFSSSSPSLFSTWNQGWDRRVFFLASFVQGQVALSSFHPGRVVSLRGGFCPAASILAKAQSPILIYQCVHTFFLKALDSCYWHLSPEHFQLYILFITLLLVYFHHHHYFLPVGFSQTFFLD